MRRPVDPATLAPHAFARLFPLLEPGELAELSADVKAHGLYAPILLFQGQVLDGRNRLAACLEAGVEPRFEHFKGSEVEALLRVLGANLHRRHLPAAQRAAIAAQLLPMERALREAERVEVKSENEGRGRGRGKGKGGRDRDEGSAADRAGDKLGVSGRSVRKAEQVKEDAPDVYEALMAGEVRSLPEARALADLPEDERREALAMPASERRLHLASRAAEDQDPADQARTSAQRALGELDVLVGLASRLLHLPERTRQPMQAVLTELLDAAAERLTDLREQLDRVAEESEDAA